ncbi:MAG: DnaJ domain-containing protein [Chloroflexi bacterium]|nr:DnaJ domain-containing protein [Chloroflexota bacterium]MCI0580665.1 DnaJ domain-containing protein [Chloroflexota bacterium]MCI0648681.1 DnaJ domain-containing protein [Chloroflexota bacterium]MCI0728089.1 DnaJ domain-containing protein [Chloroflexota bacterium]
MTTWPGETLSEKLARLRAALKEAQEELIESEAELADRLAEVHAFEREFEAGLGVLVDQLATLERELNHYQERMRRHRNQEVFGSGYASIEEQFRRTWEVPPTAAPTPPPEPVSPATEQQIKRLYRQLARRYHPDLASDTADREYRTEKMTAVNDAYAARSLAELVALSEEPDVTSLGRGKEGQTESQMVAALQAELARIHKRLRQIEAELSRLHHRASVQLSLEMKLAQRRGRNMLAEMAAELQQKIARKTAERDFLKAQFDQLES